MATICAVFLAEFNAEKGLESHIGTNIFFL
jgi:hypothetical protein